MKSISVTLAVLGTALALAGSLDAPAVVSLPTFSMASDALPEAVDYASWDAADDNEVIQEYCVRCHSDRRLRGNLSLETFDASAPRSPMLGLAATAKINVTVTHQGGGDDRT